jgi:uncharacterized flavoprotein (TIGR03862 family)
VTRIAVIGAGPAGLMAAQAASEGASRADARIDVYDAMPSAGRKFLLAGKGGLNLTHSEPLPAFVGRYGGRREQLAPMIEAFGPQALRAWAAGLGIETFVGSSGRVFPAQMKAAPLLRAWLHRLRIAGVGFHMRHRWLGLDAAGAGDGLALRFASPAGEQRVLADAVVLALGGASWPRLGSDGAWVPSLLARGVDVAPLQPANCGFDIAWSAHLRGRHAGAPLKSVAIRRVDEHGRETVQRGECVITEHGIEGSLVYAFSAALRDEIARTGTATLHLDLLPDLELGQVRDALALPRGSRSFAEHLRRRLGLQGAKAALVHEVVRDAAAREPAWLAGQLKSLPLRLERPRPIDEAISSAGGVRFEALDEGSMLRALPGVFCAGEMLDWEAPTGGYLLTACFASGRVAGRAAADWIARGTH